MIKRNHSRLKNFFAGTVKFTKTLEDTKNYSLLIEKRIAEKSYFPYIIKDRETGKFIGLVDIKNIDWTIPKAEIGYFIDKNSEGQGIITKAVKELLIRINKEFKFKKILCRSVKENLGSIAVAKRNGFEYEGTIRRDYRTSDGDLVDLEFYGKLYNY